METKNVFMGKTDDVKLIDQKESKRDMTFRLCDCEFQIKVVKPKILKCSSSLVNATIYTWQT